MTTAGSPGSTGNRLIDAFATVTDPSNHLDLLPKLNQAKLIEADYDYFCDIIKESPHPLLVELLSSGCWNGNRSAMHVLARSFRYTLSVIEAKKSGPISYWRQYASPMVALLENIAYYGFHARDEENALTDADYDEMSRYLNAKHLIDELYLSTKEISAYHEMKNVITPLMEHQDIIEPALGTVYAVRSAVSHTSSIRVPEIIGMARSIHDCPEVAPYLITFAKERGYYNTEVAMESAKTASRALHGGVL